MSTRDRRDREKTQLKEAILVAAVGMAADQGWSKVSIRGISQKIDYSTMVVYSLFGSKEKLLEELRIQGFQRLFAAVRAVPRDPRDLRVTIKGITRATMDFYLQNRELYQIMFGVIGLPGVNCSAQPQEHVMEIARYIKGILQELFNEDPQLLFFNWWALVHGSISMVPSLDDQGFQEKMYLLDHAMDRFLR